MSYDAALAPAEFPNDGRHAVVNALNEVVNLDMDQMKRQLDSGASGVFPKVGHDRSLLSVRLGEITFSVGPPKAHGVPKIQSSLNGYNGKAIDLKYAESQLEAEFPGPANANFRDGILASLAESELHVWGVSTQTIEYGTADAGSAITVAMQGVTTFPAELENAEFGRRVVARVPTRKQQKDRAGAGNAKLGMVKGKCPLLFSIETPQTHTQRMAQHLALYLKNSSKYYRLFRANISRGTRSVMLALESMIQADLMKACIFLDLLVDEGVVILNPLHAADQRLGAGAQSQITHVPGRRRPATPMTADLFSSTRNNIADRRPHLGFALRPFYLDNSGGRFQSAIRPPRANADRSVRAPLDFTSPTSVGAYDRPGLQVAVAVGATAMSDERDGSLFGGLVAHCFTDDATKEYWTGLRTTAANRMNCVGVENDRNKLRHEPFTYMLPDQRHYTNDQYVSVDGVKKPNDSTEAGNYVRSAQTCAQLAFVAKEQLHEYESRNAIGTVTSAGRHKRMATCTVSKDKRF